MIGSAETFCQGKLLFNEAGDEGRGKGLASDFLIGGGGKQEREKAGQQEGEREWPVVKLCLREFSAILPGHKLEFWKKRNLSGYELQCTQCLAARMIHG